MARSPFGDFRRHGPSFSSNGWNCETSKAKSHSSDLAGDQIRAAKHPFRVPNMSLGDQFRVEDPQGSEESDQRFALACRQHLRAMAGPDPDQWRATKA
jgi:hypothetical protein